MISRSGIHTACRTEQTLELEADTVSEPAEMDRRARRTAERKHAQSDQNYYTVFVGCARVQHGLVCRPQKGNSAHGTSRVLYQRLSQRTAPPPAFTDRTDRVV